MTFRSAHRSAGGVVDALVFAGIPLAGIALPVVAHLVSPVLALVLSGILGVLVALFATSAVPATLLGIYLFQNTMVSIVSPWVTDLDEFNRVRAYNFLITAVIWATLTTFACFGWASLRPAVRRSLVVGFLAAAVVGIYLVIGLSRDVQSALVYLRNVLTPILLFQACLIAAVRSPGGLQRTLVPLGMVAIGYGYAELLWRGTLYDVINADAYLAIRARQEGAAAQWVQQMAETGYVVRGIDDTLRVTLLNTPLLSHLNVEVFRLLGPNFHSISYAYALCFFSLLFLATGRFAVAAAGVPLILFIGSKGALATLVLAAVALAATRYLPARAVLWGFVLVLLVYVASAIVVGLRLGDYHVLGFIGGLNGFLQNPLGHGLGAGGNLSTAPMPMDWSRAQRLGTTDRAVESAVGVLLFQIGVGCAVLLGAYAWFARAAWLSAQRAWRPTAAVAALAVLTLLANGVLQEEALFAPLALGSFLILAAIGVGEGALGREAATRRRAYPRFVLTGAARGNA